MSYDVLHMFSSGLDSLVSAKVLQAQGLRVLGLHFFTPFFGKPEQVPIWAAKYGLDIEALDLSERFVDMLIDGPPHGFGKHLNPCVDCKIVMLRAAKELLPHYGARFLSTGEVLGQRPMSQRRDTLNIISREAGVRDLLLRPLSARHMTPTPMEEEGLVRREGLYGISGRGRRAQLDLAASFGLTDLPTPAGGCLLTERESACRYWPLLRLGRRPRPDDFRVANIGRQYWSGRLWLAIGRNQADNQALADLAGPDDLVFRLPDLPGPLGLARAIGQPWPTDMRREAAALVAGFSPKARALGQSIRVELSGPDGPELVQVWPLGPADSGLWTEPDWALVREEKSKDAGTGSTRA